ncbi:Ff.00g023060.m01.CDS01 [Fusarium sp. VM40]|nr:Ff.00g023060.m01.CDS01 [Fusarium sp. VM40]
MAATSPNTDAPSVAASSSHIVYTRGSSGEPSAEDLQRKPWKFIGYRGYTSFIASDHDFHIFRRFKELNVRTALLLQDGISCLEEQLAQMDDTHSKKTAQDVHNGSFRKDAVEDRMLALELISEKLYRYNKFMLQQSALNQFSDAPRRDVRSIRNWHYNHGSAAILNEEQKYLDQDDLFCVLQKDKTPLRRMIDKSYRLRTMDLWRRPDTVPDYDASHVSYYSDKRIDHFASGVIIAIGTCLLIIPLWILQALNTLKIKLAVITVFIFVFLLILSISMASKPFEALAATAAYAAILMVFIQLGSD